MKCSQKYLATAASVKNNTNYIGGREEQKEYSAFIEPKAEQD